jgi:2-keto-4-pentenoate hydratase/2-oxohepta-3-ene-1,7-dioic acid hydratase in catechol pathway
MRLCRFMSSDGPRWAVVDGEEAVETRWSPFEGPFDAWGPRHRLADLRLLAPCTPTKVVCASGTYMQVIRDMNKKMPEEPLLFLKPPSAVIGPGDNIRWPGDTEDLTHEPELAVVIGRPCRDVGPDSIDEYILGYTCANDVSAWDVLQREVHFTRSKGYDTFCPVGPFVVKEPGLDPDDLGIRSYVNGEVALETRTDDMVFKVRDLVSFCSRCMTLQPGDVISTGASGVGHVSAGDRVEVEIDGVGRLTNHVAR